MKRFIVIAVLGATTFAFAGKLERDFMTKEVVPAMRDAEAKWKASCQCVLAISVDETTVKTHDELLGARSIASYIADGIPKYCTDEASRKALCQMKTLVLAKAQTAGFTFKNGK